MLSAFIIFGVGIASGLVVLADDVLTRKDRKSLERAFAERNESVTDFCVRLLLTKGRDWSLNEILCLNEQFDLDMYVNYAENKEAKDSRKLLIFFKKQLVTEYNWRPTDPVIKATNRLGNQEELSAEDNVKLEAVFAHLHNIYAYYEDRNKKEAQIQLEKEQKRKDRENERTKKAILILLTHEPSWNDSLPFLNWSREINEQMIILKLSRIDEIHYIYFYDKVNKKGHSKVAKTEREGAFLALQPTIDNWCLQHIKK